MLAPYGVEVKSSGDLGLEIPEETGATFEENAEIKALAASTACNLPALADDSGIVIPALGGAPGIYSARWGNGNDFTPAFERIQRELGDIQHPVSAYFYCALCFAVPGQSPTFYSGRLDGTLTFPPRGDQGFGYDPIFIPEGKTITLAEMDSKRKNTLSHRARALQQFILQQFLAKSA